MTPAVHLRMMRELPQPIRTLAYGLVAAWIVAMTGFVAGSLFDLDIAVMKWFILPLPLAGAANGVVGALNIRNNAVGLTEVMRKQGTHVSSVLATRALAAASSVMALVMAGVIVRMGN